ncbi:hypothetical protein NK718_12745 [Alsobacter sp. SYSU M60028]|uniref:Uncharacterized protein n=1 Tax=Alsobacter ponti TaxID=2962936 RepID=A0ABT1LD05_9HYPH|nr:hypothetical protein [Alsobacter ponti]MCP8939385.1 hypothetical protein [Alsobacter ponti]
MADLEGEELKKHVKERQAIFVEILSKTYDRAAAYTNVVLIGGYAAAFTIWSNTKMFLPKSATLWTGGLLLLSLSAFVFFEVIKMVLNAKLFLSMYSLALSEQEPVAFERKVKEAQLAEQRLSVVMVRWWILTLIICVPSALVSLFILIVSYATAIYRLE